MLNRLMISLKIVIAILITVILGLLSPVTALIWLISGKAIFSRVDKFSTKLFRESFNALDKITKKEE